MKLLAIILSVAATAGALGLLVMSNRSQPTFTNNEDRSQIERFEGVFPSTAIRGHDRQIELSEANRQTYAVHFALPSGTPWSNIQDESIDRILMRANQNH